MGYPNFGQVKTIVLPFMTNSKDENTIFTIDEYKKDTGIDLRDFIVLRGNSIYFDSRALILATCFPSFLRKFDYENGGQTNYAPLASVTYGAYESGVTDGLIYLDFKGLCGTGFFGDVRMIIRILKEKSFEINNIDIVVTEN